MTPILQKAVQVAGNPVAGYTVGTGTSATGAVTYFNWIPADIGLFFSLIGGILTLFTLYAVIVKHKLETNAKREAAERERAEEVRREELHQLAKQKETLEIQLTAARLTAIESTRAAADIIGDANRD